MERIVNNNIIAEVERRMGRIGQIHMRVPKDNLGELKKLEGNVASLFQQAHEFADTDAISLDLQFNAKRRAQTEKAEEILRTLTKNIRRNELAAEAFESLTVRMEDTEHNNAMEVFDLLSDKAKIRITVNKKPNGSGLDSEDLFQKIANEMHRLKYL
jgi:broad specificity polyphosphatase/5'/3'-nucleotidase SurE